MRKSKKLILTIAGTLGIAAVMLAAVSFTSRSGPSSARIGDTKVALEVAATKKDQQNGLKMRTALADNSGMVFVFRPRKQHVNFWMQETLIPLDLIFVRDGKVIKTFEHLEPESAFLRSPAKYGCDDVTEAIEVKAGYVSSNHIKVGDPVIFDLHYDPKILEDYSERISHKVRGFAYGLGWKL